MAISHASKATWRHSLGYTLRLHPPSVAHISRYQRTALCTGGQLQTDEQQAYFYEGWTVQEPCSLEEQISVVTADIVGLLIVVCWTFRPILCFCHVMVKVATLILIINITLALQRWYCCVIFPFIEGCMLWCSKQEYFYFLLWK